MEDDSSNDPTTVESSKAERSVWLMKCPPVVAKAWQSSAAAADTTPVAKVVVALDPLRGEEDQPLLQFTMEMAGSEAGPMPKSYSLNMFNDFVPMCVFSETNQGVLRELHTVFSPLTVTSKPVQKPLALSLTFEHMRIGSVATEGKVEHKFDMKPHHKNIEAYRKMCRERTNKSMVKTRQVQVIDNDRGVHMRPGIMSFSASTSKEKKKAVPVKGPEIKRTRRDRGELEDIMFKLFERQPNWALKQLVLETDQPAQFLKEILNELCVYNKRGTNQGTYELKPEYKKSVEETGAD